MELIEWIKPTGPGAPRLIIVRLEIESHNKDWFLTVEQQANAIHFYARYLRSKYQDQRVTAEDAGKIESALMEYTQSHRSQHPSLINKNRRGVSNAKIRSLFNQLIDPYYLFDYTRSTLIKRGSMEDLAISRYEQKREDRNVKRKSKPAQKALF